jgi:GlcNAc-P-P-Und epimerase
MSAKSCLITGANGFLGSIIRNELINFFRIYTCGRSELNDIICDLSMIIPELQQYDYVIHAAGKAHSIPKNKIEDDEFHQVNYQGTVNLIKGLEKTSLPQSFIFISSVAVYGLNAGLKIDENYPLISSSPYAQSKIDAEKYVIDWGERSNVSITILRLPLIVGQNPPGNLGAMKNAISKGYYFRLGDGKSRKSTVWAEDVAKIIPQCFETNGIFNLTDEYNPSIAELDVAISYGLKKKIRILPLWLVRLLILPSKLFPFWPINKGGIDKLTTSLTFSSKKASLELDWKPRSVIDCISEYGI